MSKQDELEQLIRQMRLGTNEEAKAAVDELRERGWLTDRSLQGSNLSGANLHEADLHEAKLYGAELYGATLYGANLERAILSRAKLDRAKLYGADLSRANLERADLSRADLSRVILHEANLYGAILQRAILYGADLTDAIIGYTSFDDVDLSDVKDLETVKHDFPSSIGIDTIFRSQGKLPREFMEGCGVPKEWIDYILDMGGIAVEFFSAFISHSHETKTLPDGFMLH